MKKLLINLLAISLISGTITACSTGGGSSSGPSGPAAPSASELAPPAGSALAGGTSGAAINLSQNQIALPGASAYVSYAMDPSVTAAIGPAVNAGTAIVATSGNNILINVPSGDGLNTITYVLTPVATSGQSQSLQATSTSFESYTYPAAEVTTNLLSTESATVFPHGLVYGTAKSLVVLAPNTSGLSPVNFPISTCAGATGSASAVYATVTQGTPYLSFGTSAGSVCVVSGADAKVTNLATQAPAGKYTAGNVNSFGFPATLNTGNSLVGYWNVGTVGSAVNVYRITGSYVNGQPTGNGFLNTTSPNPQTTTNGTTQVTFTNVPSTSMINSSYVDASGNVWVGTTNGSVYVLRTGATAWTNTALSGQSGAVTVKYNGSTSGATAVAANAGGSVSFSLN
ncbi:MAG: hypothetical protein EKK54_11485 [Neisseriaceae bacterium]|nr:MAG: hypothetical protein EKK54_11485 [Neisseriaceae bacterium]